MGSKTSVDTKQDKSDENGLLENDEELKKCVDSLSYTIKYKGQKAAQDLLKKLHENFIGDLLHT